MLIMGDWKFLQENLVSTIRIIFNGYDINDLNSYEKRKIIFEYLTNTLNYDYDMLEKIRECKVFKTKLRRAPIEELFSVINNKIGICNAISQYYKLLLEILDVKSYCVICDDGTEVNHQLNMVYDSDNNSYSFDDITSVIVGKGTIEDYFDYDLQFAKSVNQGNKNILDDQSFIILPEDYINYLVNREISMSDTLERLPDNIVSIKHKSKSK
jgi:hypothetical protein